MKKNPFKVLNVNPAKYDDNSLKKAYLELIKKYTPENSPEEFEEIRTAYNTIRNAKSPYEMLSLAPVNMTGINTPLLAKDHLKAVLEEKLGIKKAKINLKKNSLLKELEEIINDTRD
ncbi:MAG: DnaJ domain-containing protein [Pseudomonadota bacterium]